MWRSADRQDVHRALFVSFNFSQRFDERKNRHPLHALTRSILDNSPPYNHPSIYKPLSTLRSLSQVNKQIRDYCIACGLFKSLLLSLHNGPSSLALIISLLSNPHVGQTNRSKIDIARYSHRTFGDQVAICISSSSAIGP